MSQVTKRKRVMNEELWGNFNLPKENQSIVKVLRSPGNNLHQITTPSGEEYLVSMPPKFRRNIWVKRGAYILVEPIVEGNKVKAEIVKIMNKDSIKYCKEKNAWPKEFDDILINKKGSDIYSDEFFVNPNRITVTYGSDDDDCSDSDSNDYDDSN